MPQAKSLLQTGDTGHKEVLSEKSSHYNQSSHALGAGGGSAEMEIWEKKWAD
jgi:hypothetical protein